MARSLNTAKNTFNELEYKNYRLYGRERSALEFVEEKQLCDMSLWSDFVDVFRRHPDSEDQFWRGEYWGKMMRGACMTYSCTGTYSLYRIITASIYDMISTQDKFGRISSYSVGNEFKGWDMWCRKYVMLGMEYYIDICKDKKLVEIIISSLKKQADYIVAKIGDEPGKIDIFDTTGWWGGLNSCSILEPFVRLYNLTNEQKYLDFAEYIISKGFCKGINLIETCYNKTMFPYEFPYTKAYEMMSCFEGLLEYYRIRGGEKYLIAVKNFVDMVADTDVSIIGCCGCTHELFDHSAVMQTEPAKDFIMQETCVTVTWMKLCFNLLKLTGEQKYAALIEKSGYNAMLGSVNFNLNDLKLCINQTENLNHGVKFIFDSYSPLYYDRRGKKIGGYMDYKPDYFYGCCNCIGAAGIAIMNKYGILSTCDGVVISNFRRSRFENDSALIELCGDLNKTGSCEIKIKKSPENGFDIKLLIPEWLQNAVVYYNGTNEGNLNGTIYEKRVKSGDEFKIKGAVPIKKVILNGKIAFEKGAIVLARDEEVGENFEMPVPEKSRLAVSKCNVPCEYYYTAECDGKEIYFIDYASAGQNYDREPCRLTVWSNTKK